MVKVIKITHFSDGDRYFFVSVNKNISMMSEERFFSTVCAPHHAKYNLESAVFSNGYFGDTENDLAWDLYQFGKDYIDIPYNGDKKESYIDCFDTLWKYLKGDE